VKAKIFIESDSATFHYQMANFIIGCNEPDAIYFFLVSKSLLNECFLSNYQAKILSYTPEMLPEVFNKITDFLLLHKYGAIEINMDLSVSGALMIPFISKMKEQLNSIRICLYDSDIENVADRLTLEELPDKQRQDIFYAYSLALSKMLFDGRDFISEAEWNPIINYVVGDVIDVVYYINNNPPLSSEFYRKRSEYMCYSEVKLNEFQCVYYLHLCQLPLSTYEELKAITFAENTALFIPGEPASSYSKEAYYSSLKKEIKSAEGRGFSTYEMTVLFTEVKGGEDKSIAEMFKGRTVKIPSEYTLSALTVLGLIPHKIFGAFSKEISLLGNVDVLFSMINKSDFNYKLKVILCSNITRKENILYIDEYEEYLQSSHIQPQRRFFYAYASMGDVVFAIGSLGALREHYSEEFVFLTNNLYADIINSCPIVDTYWDINELTEEQRFEFSLANHVGKAHNVTAWEQILSGKHQTDAVLDMFPEYFSDEMKHPVISLLNFNTDRVNEFIDKYNLKNKKVALLHPNFGAPNRTWTENEWRELTGYFLNNDWKVIFIGSNNNKQIEKTMMSLNIPEVIDAVNKFSILETVALMRHCQLLVACDSGPVALAGMTNIAICALYSLIPAAWRLPYRHGEIGWNALGIDVSCRYGQCGKLIQDKKFFEQELHVPWYQLSGDEFSAWCPNNKHYDCLKKYKARQLWNEISIFLASEKYICN
jgi:ADP-heptose:LPS heptosyltransferase